MGKSNKRKRSLRSRNTSPPTHSAVNSGSERWAQIAFLFLAHLLFVLITAGVLLAALPVAYFINYNAGAVLTGIAAFALIIHYQRIGKVLERIINYLGIAKHIAAQATKTLQDFYVAGLAICHVIPFFVLLYTLNGSFWVYQHPVEYLSAPSELPPNTVAGIYHIEDSRVIDSLGYRLSIESLQSSQEARYSNTDRSTTWKIMPLVSSREDQEQVEFSIQSGKHCVWLGSKDSTTWIENRLQASAEGQYFQERDSRDVGRYFNLLKENLGGIDLPPCTRILERIPAPEPIQAAYYRFSLLVFSLAHGIPIILSGVFYYFSDAGQKRNKVS